MIPRLEEGEMEGECVIVVTKATACRLNQGGRDSVEGQTAEVQTAKSTLKCGVPGGVGVEEMGNVAALVAQ